jgi:hypothetical protein
VIIDIVRSVDGDPCAPPIADALSLNPGAHGVTDLRSVARTVTDLRLSSPPLAAAAADRLALGGEPDALLAQAVDAAVRMHRTKMRPLRATRVPPRPISTTDLVVFLSRFHGTSSLPLFGAGVSVRSRAGIGR